MRALLYTKLQVDGSGNRLAWQASPLVQRTALCPTALGYWGDYDDLEILDVANNVPTFIRTHTDSEPQCTDRGDWFSSPTHVSAHAFQ